MAPRKKNQGAKPMRKGFTLTALPVRNFNQTAGWDSPEKEISGRIVEEVVGSFHNENDDNDSLKEHIFSIASAKLPSISSSISSNKNDPTRVPSSSSNSSSVKKSSNKSSPDTSVVLPFSSIHVSGPERIKDLMIGMVNIVESFCVIG